MLIYQAKMNPMAVFCAHLTLFHVEVMLVHVALIFCTLAYLCHTFVNRFSTFAFRLKVKTLCTFYNRLHMFLTHVHKQKSCPRPNSILVCEYI